LRSEPLVEQDKLKAKKPAEERNQNGPQQRPYIDELDQIRAITIFCMVAVHVLIYTAFLAPDPLGTQVFNGVYNAVRFTRTIFMFITAAALVSTYYGKPFSFMGFWKKRSVGVLLPYVIWTIIYTTINDPQHSLWAFLITTLKNVLSGNASIQLYYIGITLQFYLLLPGFLWLLQRAKQHPWTLVGVSFVLQIILWTVDYYTLEAHIPSTGFFALVARYQYRFVFLYQFYFVLGGVVALHLSEVRAWLLSHRTWVFVAVGVTLTARTLVYVFQFDVAHLPIDYTVEVLQPVMVFYSVSVIAFLFWLAYRSVRKRDPQRPSRGRRFWRTLSDASFGVYLVHPIVMGLVFIWVIFPLRSWVPGLVCVALTWLLTAFGSTVWSLVFMNLPILSRLVGRSHRMSDQALLTGWLKRQVARSNPAVQTAPVQVPSCIHLDAPSLRQDAGATQKHTR
jgi:probable poly-beta-1,6-N-acetyl-D-glucosamine export protein